ncbi:MAG: hypothetical protein KGJ86_07940 [Chloroflexota bacterium]|nr:hypothetical protein [Chloroflexota bacterium]
MHEGVATHQALSEERRKLLSLELTSLGVDVRRLTFLRWLIDHGHHPEWTEVPSHRAGAQPVAERLDYSPFQ